MNINDLTIGQARELIALLSATAAPIPTVAPIPTAASTTPHPFVGRYVICRCTSAGVHAGFLVSQTGDQAVLRHSRRLWSWKAKSGVALSGLAINGLQSGKVDTLLPIIALTGVIETIPTSDAAQESIHGA